MVIMKSTQQIVESAGVIESGRVSKIRHHPRSLENEEIQMYLSKLKELVPFMPKNRKLSKLEVIQYVIDYICDLQSALDTTHPTISAAAVAAVVSGSAVSSAAAAVSMTSSSSRQPLVVIPPNTISPVETPVLAPIVHLADKAQSSDSRPSVSC